jgi:hypothetical protein
MAGSGVQPRRKDFARELPRFAGIERFFGAGARLTATQEYPAAALLRHSPGADRFGHIDKRGQDDVRCALRSDTPT